MSLNVWTKNSVDEPSKVTIQVEGRPPCRDIPTGSILVLIITQQEQTQGNPLYSPF